MTSHLEPALLAIAAGQHGLFTTQQALRLGMTKVALVDAVKDGTLLHPGRGLYAVRSLVDPDSPESWHRSLAYGSSLLWDDALLTGASAVLANDVRLWGVDLSRVRVLRPVDRTIRLPSFQVRRWRGQPATSTPLGPSIELPDALAQLAVDQGIVQGVVSADHALQTGLVSLADLTAAAEVVGPWRHGSRALAMVAFVDSRRESVGESRCAVALSVAGLVVDPQVEIRDQTGHLVGRVDFLVRGTNVIVEFDGRMKYDSGDPAVLWAEKKREDGLRRLGYVVVRITWADLERPGAAVAKVRAALAAA